MLRRREFFRLSSLGLIASLFPGTVNARSQTNKITGITEIHDQSGILEADVHYLQNEMKSGRLSSEQLVKYYLERIKDIDKSGATLNAVIELNPDAVKIARQMDIERNKGIVRSQMHGIPVMIKDNIDTGDKMLTTAGSKVLSNNYASKDSFVVQKLRESGAIVLGKTNLSEWANFRSTRSSSGWSSRGGQTRNPYVLDRSPCGSSSGSGVAVSANLCSVAIGTETDGSIVCPASTNGIVGIKPTVGLISRSGIIPISHSQDTAGPMARTVSDAAILLGVMTGTDALDNATKNSNIKHIKDFAVFLKKNGLEGKRIGIDRSNFGFHDKVDEVIQKNLDLIEKAGARLIQLEKITLEKFDWDDEMQLLLFEFKHDLEKYFKTTTEPEIKTLSDLISINEKNDSDIMSWFGQEIFYMAQDKKGLDSPEYKEIKERINRIVRVNGIDRVMKENRLDAIVAPTGGPAWNIDLVNGDHYIGGSSSLAAMAGYPNITVPAGFIHNLPVGISFFGMAMQEPVLIEIAYAFEQLTKHRKPPQYNKTIEF